MKIVNVAQGTPEWHKLRDQHNTASEAPIMMGVSRHMSRDELLKMKAVGNYDELHKFVQGLYDAGHATEQMARVIAEDILGQELYPATVVDDENYLSASFDGLTMDGEILFEHKLWNKELVAAMEAGDVPEENCWQLEQQLLISKAKKVLFVCSDGTKDKWRHLFYSFNPERRAQLMAGWKQFDEDLKAYKYKEPAIIPSAKTIMELPALSVEIIGEVKSSNLDVFQSKAMTFIRSINTDLKTDQDFADAEEAIKFCDKAEKELDLVKKQALSQTLTIDMLFRSVDAIKEEMRRKRLNLDKLVKQRKDSIKSTIVENAKNKFREYIFQINTKLKVVRLPEVHADFVNAIKAKKTIKSIEESINDEMARVKIEVNGIAAKFEKNLASYESIAGGHKFLFNDLNQIIGKDNGDFILLIQSRIATYEDAEKAKREAEINARAEAKTKELEAARVKKEKDEKDQADLAARLAEEIRKRGVEPTPAPEQPSVIQTPLVQSYSNVTPLVDKADAPSLSVRTVFVDQEVLGFQLIEWALEINSSDLNQRLQHVAVKLLQACPELNWQQFIRRESVAVKAAGGMR